MADGIGHVDENGYLYIVGRKARCFITYDSHGSAYKVYPERIEEVLKQNTEIEECAVVYIASKERDKEPKAYIRLRADVEFNKSMKEKIINACKNSDLPECCVLYKIECWSGEFPRINDTKVDYKKIQETAVENT